MGLADKLLSGFGKPRIPNEADPHFMVDPNQITKEMQTLGGTPGSAYAHLLTRQDPNYQKQDEHGVLRQILESMMGGGGASGGAGASASFAGGAPTPATDQMAELPPDIPMDDSSKNVVAYTVKPGDNLITIAKRVYGDPSKFRKIAEANGIKDANMIKVGQRLMIPPGMGEV